MTPATALPTKYDGRLQGGTCAACGALAFPPPPVCTACLSTEILAYPLPRTGTLYSFTVVHLGEAGRQMVGYADLADGLRLFGRIESDTVPAIEGQVQIAAGDAASPCCLFTPVTS